jgi:hypothetical protein
MRGNADARKDVIAGRGAHVIGQAEARCVLVMDYKVRRQNPVEN